MKLDEFSIMMAGGGVIAVTLMLAIVAAQADDTLQTANGQTSSETSTKSGKGGTTTKSAATKSTTTVTSTKTVKSSANSVQWHDLVNGGKLPYGSNVTLTGKLSDLTCGNQAISSALDIKAIAVSYLGQTSAAATATIAGTDPDSTWSVSLGSLPADTAVNLQLKITGNISAENQGTIVDDLLADAYFQAALKAFLDAPTGNTAAGYAQAAQILLDTISSKSGPLTKILQAQLPSCVVTSDVTSAAVKGLNSTVALDLPRRISDFAGGAGRVLQETKPAKLDTFAPGMNAQELDAFLRSVCDAKFATCTFKSGGKDIDNDSFKAALESAAQKFETSYAAARAAFQTDVVAQISQGVVLSQSSTTQDLNKYAGFDAGALYAPRINELRGYYMVHIYPYGPVELTPNGDWWNPKERWSIAIGESTGDISANGASRVKGDKAFVYGMGYRLNKYFRVSAGAMLYRDTQGGHLNNEVFVGPSIDITALSALKSIFASSSSKSTTPTTTKTSTKTSTKTPTATSPPASQD